MGRMRLRSAIAPLLGGATYRRGVFLLLGGVILLPYILLAEAFVRMYQREDVPRAAAGLLLVATIVIAAVPAFLAGTRALEIAAARALLDVDLPEPGGTGAGPDRETRLRGALWFVAHLVVGGLVGLALLIALPMALIFIGQRFGVGPEALDGLRIGPLDEHDSGWLTLIGLVMLVVIIYLVAGLGATAASLAPALLGPSASQRIAALEMRAGQLAERNRLARELHDSVGHALTVATLQAAAAHELLDRDPEFVRRALRSIEEAGRTAMEDLDYVLGVLREHEAHDDKPVPQRTLGDLDKLLADTRAAGQPVAVEVSGPVGSLPAAVSREAYRIVQEGLTNAARHAAGRPVTLRVAAGEMGLELELVNAVSERSGPTRASRRGRGLDGVRERVTLLGGQMTAGREGGCWRVAVWLPHVVGGERGRAAA